MNEPITQNAEPSAALIQTIARIVQETLRAQQLQQQGTPASAHAQLPSLPPRQPTQLDPTPVLSTPSTGNLSRSSSGVSTASVSSSASSLASTRSLASSSSASSIKRKIDFNAPGHRKRKRSDPQLSRDKKVVAGPVLDALDATYLAPRQSAMFRRRLKRTPNPDGTRSLKKNPDIVMSLFKSCVRPIIRRLLGNQRMCDMDLVNRYFRAALAVVTKRRANHTQHWRRFGKSRPTYSAVFDYDNDDENSVSSSAASVVPTTTPITNKKPTPPLSPPPRLRLKSERDPP